jgi:hypothetical protein
MKYFQTLPKIASIDYVGNKVVLTNLLIRAEVIPSLLNNPLLFYQYDIQNDDTPEIIADKYYGDPYRYWIVLFANQIIDPQWNWPMNTNLFNDYIIDKYTSDTANSLNISANTVTYGQVLAYTQGTVKNYIKSVTTTDTYSSTSNTSVYILDQASYNTVIEGTTTANFSTGTKASVIKNVIKYTQSLYDYEVEQNESMRSINLVNSSYVPQFESQFKALMKQ